MISRLLLVGEGGFEAWCFLLKTEILLILQAFACASCARRYRISVVENKSGYEFQKTLSLRMIFSIESPMLVGQICRCDTAFLGERNNLPLSAFFFITFLSSRFWAQASWKSPLFSAFFALSVGRFTSPAYSSAATSLQMDTSRSEWFILCVQQNLGQTFSFAFSTYRHTVQLVSSPPYFVFSGLRKFAEIYEVFSMLIIAKDSALTYQTSTQEYVVFNVSGWIISMGRCNSLA